MANTGLGVKLASIHHLKALFTYEGTPEDLEKEVMVYEAAGNQRRHSGASFFLRGRVAQSEGPASGKAIEATRYLFSLDYETTGVLLGHLITGLISYQSLRCEDISKQLSMAGNRRSLKNAAGIRIKNLPDFV